MHIAVNKKEKEEEEEEEEEVSFQDILILLSYKKFSWMGLRNQNRHIVPPFTTE